MVLHVNSGASGPVAGKWVWWENGHHDLDMYVCLNYGTLFQNNAASEKLSIWAAYVEVQSWIVTGKLLFQYPLSFCLDMGNKMVLGLPLCSHKLHSHFFFQQLWNPSSLLVFTLQEQLSQVLDAMFERAVKVDEHVIDQGDDGDNFYVIER